MRRIAYDAFQQDFGLLVGMAFIFKCLVYVALSACLWIAYSDLVHMVNHR